MQYLLAWWLTSFVVFPITFYCIDTHFCLFLVILWKNSLPFAIIMSKPTIAVKLFICKHAIHTWPLHVRIYLSFIFMLYPLKYFIPLNLSLTKRFLSQSYFYLFTLFVTVVVSTWKGFTINQTFNYITLSMKHGKANSLPTLKQFNIFKYNVLACWKLPSLVISYLSFF